MLNRREGYACLPSASEQAIGSRGGPSFKKFVFQGWHTLSACRVQTHHDAWPVLPSVQSCGKVTYALINCWAASTIFGASGRNHAIIPAAPGPGTSGKASLRALMPGTSCTTSAMTCEPKPPV